MHLQKMSYFHPLMKPEALREYFPKGSTTNTRQQSSVSVSSFYILLSFVSFPFSSISFFFSLFFILLQKNVEFTHQMQSGDRSPIVIAVTGLKIVSLIFVLPFVLFYFNLFFLLFYVFILYRFHRFRNTFLPFRKFLYFPHRIFMHFKHIIPFIFSFSFVFSFVYYLTYFFVVSLSFLPLFFPYPSSIIFSESNIDKI